jgi:hypothetical protein
VFRWLLDYWYIPLLGIGAVLAFLWFRPRGKEVAGVFQKIQKELGVIRAGRDARAALIEQDQETVTKALQKKYEAQLEALDAEKKAEAARLEQDPVALAKYLERLTR